MNQIFRAVKLDTMEKKTVLDLVRRKEGVPLCELKDWVRCRYQDSRNGNKTVIAAGLCIQDNTKKPDVQLDLGSDKTSTKGPKPQCNLCQAMGRDQTTG